MADEKTAVGNIAKGALKTYLQKKKVTDEDLVSGVSALMHHAPAIEITSKTKKKKYKAKRKKTKASN